MAILETGERWTDKLSNATVETEKEPVLNSNGLQNPNARDQPLMGCQWKAPFSQLAQNIRHIAAEADEQVFLIRLRDGDGPGLTLDCNKVFKYGSTLKENKCKLS